MRGLEIWQAHPYRRTLRDPPAIWSDGCSRLIDYGAVPEATDPAGPPVLVVPSLINRAYILDLAPGRSALRWLAAQGLRPILMDWGTPGPDEAGFDLHAYGARRLLPALAHVRAATGRPAAVLGYCMGGTLTVGLAARAPDLVAALALIGAPWDFASTRGIAGGFRAIIRAEGPERTERLLDAMAAAFGMVPVSLFQMLFALVNPMQAALKFRKLSRLDPDGVAARLFVALEDWLADGVPMPAGAAKDLLVDWQIRNATAAGSWRFLGAPVDPGRVAAPTLVICGQSDLIAPPALAEPLGRAIPGARTIRPRTGHVGMVVGRARALPDDHADMPGPGSPSTRAPGIAQPAARGRAAAARSLSRTPQNARVGMLIAAGSTGPSRNRQVAVGGKLRICQPISRVFAARPASARRPPASPRARRTAARRRRLGRGGRASGTSAPPGPGSPARTASGRASPAPAEGGAEASSSRSARAGPSARIIARKPPATPRVEAKSQGAPIVASAATPSGARAASPAASVPPMQ